MAASAATSCVRIYEGGKKHDIQIVAINDLGNAETNAHLTRYDTAHGQFPGTVAVEGDYMVVNGDSIRCSPSAIRPSCHGASSASTWCSSAPASSPPRKRPRRHLKGGAKKVIISAPGGKDVDATIVFGVNHDDAQGAATR